MSGPQLSVFPNAHVPHHIVHADPSFLCVYKPAGVVTQPGEGHDRDTLLNGLFSTHGTTLQNLGRVRDFGLLHRLDRTTSGLVLIALTADAYTNIRAQFAERKIHKTYIAAVHGAPSPPSGTDRTPLWESREQGRKRARLGEHDRAQVAITRYQTLIRARGVTLIECHPETGRLHQVRAHMAHRGCPLVGDREYGRLDELDHKFARHGGKNVFLHAAELTFTHPMSGQRMTCRAPLPSTWVDFLVEVGIACPRKWKNVDP